jgi:serine/threonine-protein kinase
MSDVSERLTEVLAERYAVDSEIGRGGMATVFLARDLKHGRQVAIKVLHPSFSAVVGTDRFLREIETVAGLTHPHILALHDSGEAGGLLYYVMPFIDGESLRERLDRETQLPVEEAIRITREVASALDYAHTRGIVHRDVKPANVLLSDGKAVLADFGVARMVSAASGEKITATGMAVGTPAYMSPEQAAGEEADERTDTYALGCVLYELLTGEPPFTGTNARAVMAKRLTQTPTDVSTLRTSVPSGVSCAISRALARTPMDRFATAAQFARALDAAPADSFAPPPATWRTVTTYGRSVSTGIWMTCSRSRMRSPRVSPSGSK